MLPGGLGVMGVFAMAPPNAMNDAQPKLRQVLFAVNKLLRKRQLLLNVRDEEVEEARDWTILQMCTTTRKYPLK